MGLQEDESHYRACGAAGRRVTLSRVWGRRKKSHIIACVGPQEDELHYRPREIESRK